MVVGVSDQRMTPQRAMWEAQGRPALDVSTGPTDGVCALTGEHGPTWPAKTVVSDLYTDWDRLNAPPDTARFGASAVHSIRGGRTLRARPWVITDTPTAVQVGPVELGAVLSVPVDAHTCVTVPISRQIHVIPYARWGMVCSDRDQAPWTVADVDRLSVYRTLRAAGFGETVLAERTPPYPLLRRAADPAHVMTLWPELHPWRDRPSMLDVAARATRTPKEDRADDDRAA